MGLAKLTVMAGLAWVAAPLAAQELLVPGGPYEASAVPADAQGEWLALVADGVDGAAGGHEHGGV